LQLFTLTIYYNTYRLWHGTINAIANIADINSTLISENRFKLQIKLLYLEHIRSLPNEFTFRSTRCGTTGGIHAAHLWYSIWFIVGLQCNLFRSIWNSCLYVQINSYTVYRINQPNHWIFDPTALLFFIRAHLNWNSYRDKVNMFKML
jgi:hypothetical protein